MKKLLLISGAANPASDRRYGSEQRHHDANDRCRTRRCSDRA